MAMNARAVYKAKGFALKIFAASAMGGIGAFGRFINAPGDFISFGRQFFGFVCLAIAFFFMKDAWKKVREFKVSPAIVATGINLGLLSGLYVISTQYTTLANAALFIYIGPVIATLLAAAILKEKINVQRALCLITVVVGMLFGTATIAYDSGQGFYMGLDLSSTYAFGNLIALASGVAYGLFLFFSRYRLDADATTRSWYQFGIASITLLCLMAVDSFLSGGLFYTVKVDGVAQINDAGQIITAAWSPLTMDGSSWAWWAAAAFVSGFLAFYTLMLAAKMLTANELAAVSYWEVIFAAILGWVLFGEALTALQVFGGIMIVVGGAAQVLFTTKESNANTEEFVEPGVEVAAMAGGTAGVADPTPAGMDPKIEAMANAADAYDKKNA